VWQLQSADEWCWLAKSDGQVEMKRNDRDGRPFIQSVSVAFPSDRRVVHGQLQWEQQADKAGAIEWHAIPARVAHRCSRNEWPTGSNTERFAAKWTDDCAVRVSAVSVGNQHPMELEMQG